MNLMKIQGKLVYENSGEIILNIFFRKKYCLKNKNT